MGVKKIFFGGPTPKPEVELVGDEEGFCRAWGGVSDSEKFFGKFPRVIETFGVKEKPLAPPSGKSRRQIFAKFGGSQGDPRADHNAKKQRNQSREFCVIGGHRIFFRGPYLQTGSRIGRGRRGIL